MELIRTVCAAALLSLLQAASISTWAADWPGFRGPQRDGRSDETGLLLDWPKAGPPLLWTAELGQGYSMASIADGRVFVFDRVGDYERLRALAVADGKELWSQSAPVSYEDRFGFSNGPRGNPLVHDDRVYSFGVAGRLRCHDVTNGRLIWEVDTAKRYGVVTNFFGVGSNPLIHGDLLIVMVGGSPAETPDLESGKTRPDGSGLVAFDKKSGEERWRGVDDLASYSSPILSDGPEPRGYALLRSGLTVFNPNNGKTLAELPWRAKKLYSVNAATPVVDGKQLFITEAYERGGKAMRWGDSGLETIWQDARRGQALASHWGTPVLHSGWLYGCHGENRGNAELRAVRLQDGKIGWKEPGLSRTTLLWADGHLIALSEEGRLVVAAARPDRFTVVSDFVPKRANGTRLLAHPAWNAPALANGRLYVRGKDRLAVFDLRRPPVPATEGQSSSGTQARPAAKSR